MQSTRHKINQNFKREANTNEKVKNDLALDDYQDFHLVT